MLSQEDSDLDDMKDIPVFKPILRAIIRSQMKHLMKQLSRHGGEEAMVLTASVSDGAFDYLGSAVTEGFLDDKEDLRVQFLDHCMKGVADGDDTEKNDKSKGKGSAGKSPRNSRRQTGTAKGAKKRPGATVSGAKPAKRSTVSEEGEMGETIGSFDDTKMENSDSDDTLSLDLGVGKKGQHERMKEFSESGELNETEQPGPNVDPNEVVEVKVEASLDDDEVPELDDNADPDWDADEDAAGAAEAADADYEPPKAEVKKERKSLLELPPTESAMLDKSFNDTSGSDKTRTYICTTCGKHLQTASGYRRHMLLHGDDKPFTEGHHFEGHAKLYESARLFHCQKCKKSFSYSTSLNRHKRICKGSTTIQKKVEHTCHICSMKFNKKYRLEDHVRGKHGIGGTYKCHLCGKEFKWRASRSAHLKMHRLKTEKKTSEKSTIVDEPIMICKYCGKTFLRGKNGMKSLYAHERTHLERPPTMCKYCGKIYNDGGSLRQHERRHTGTQPYKCEICGSGMFSKWHYQRHMDAHAGNRKFICSRCGKAFLTQRDLKRHQAGEDSNLTFKCEFCAKSYGSRNQLKDHMNTHTGQKSHACELCPKSYFWARDLRRHISKMHPAGKSLSTQIDPTIYY